VDLLWNELTFGLPDGRQFAQVVVRLVATIIVGGLIGFQRETAGKQAGLRTHILVALGSTAFVLGALGAGMHEDAVSRIIQGIITGIGFIGAGTILKQETRVKGLTTSAGVWTTCAVGVVIGLGELGVALIAAVLVLIVLTLVARFEARYIDPETRGGRPSGGDPSE
jgi:putative Mg2+ transporter-C (MgtC) family protein